MIKCKAEKGSNLLTNSYVLKEVNEGFEPFIRFSSKIEYYKKGRGFVSVTDEIDSVTPPLILSLVEFQRMPGYLKEFEGFLERSNEKRFSGTVVSLTFSDSVAEEPNEIRIGVIFNADGYVNDECSFIMSHGTKYCFNYSMIAELAAAFRDYYKDLNFISLL